MKEQADDEDKPNKIVPADAGRLLRLFSVAFGPARLHSALGERPHSMKVKVHNVHVLSGSFPSRSEACKYTEAQWEPEPDRTVNDEDYAAWEDRNPGWRLHKDLGVFLDSDFIENIDGGNRYTHLEGMLAEKSQISLIEDRAGSGANTLVLIFTEALGGFEAKLASTPKLTYCGEYECKR